MMVLVADGHYEASWIMTLCESAGLQVLLEDMTLEDCEVLETEEGEARCTRHHNR